MADELNMDDRDPNELNRHVRVAYHDVFGEPDGAHSIDCVWRLSHSCFTGARNFCYKLMTVLCAWAYAFCWGCEFACITFSHIWAVTPGLRVWMINLGCCQKFFGACINCCLTPICESCGMCFSRITVTNQSG